MAQQEMAFIDSDLRERRRAALKEFYEQQEEMLVAAPLGLNLSIFSVALSLTSDFSLNSWNNRMEKELAAMGKTFVRERL